MAARRRKKSLIPQKAQIPVMIVGAIFLAFLVYRAVNKIRDKKAPDSPTETSLISPAPGAPSCRPRA